MRQFVRTTFFAAILALTASMASAATIIQFQEVLPFNTPFTISANGTGTATTISANTIVNVTFDPATCLVAGCGGVTNGLFNLSLSATSQGAVRVTGQTIEQNFNGSLSLTRAGGAINLLSFTFSDLFSGQAGGGNPTMNASQPPDTFLGSSNVLDPAKLGIPRGFALSFSNLSGGGLGVFGQTIRSGLADGTGTINATAETAVPEPTTMVLLGSGIAGLVARRRKARQ